MTSQEKTFHDFAKFAAKLQGAEKSEAQTFLSERFRYTSEAVFDTFPWPQFEMGGTGNLPVPSGYQPDGTGATIENSRTKKTSGATPIPRGKLPCGTGGSPVPPEELKKYAPSS